MPGITVYWASVSSNLEAKKNQQRIKMVLESKNVPFEYLDICTIETAKEAMRAICTENGVKSVAPQIVSDGMYCGDYNAFDAAVENDELDQFLSPKPK